MWMLKRFLRVLVQYAEQYLKTFGYEITWWPNKLVNEKSNRLPFSFEFVVAHLMLSKKLPFFVAIGANDGISNDPMYPFVKNFKIPGIMIEPLPSVFQDLKNNYSGFPQVECWNCGISKHDGKATLYTVKQQPGVFHKSHQFSSLHKEVISQQSLYVPNITSLIEEIKVDMIGFDTLVSKLQGREIDILQMDTEGHDYEIIKLIDFKRVRPSIIHYEHVNLSKEDQNLCSAILLAQGYKITRDSLDTTAYLLRPLA